MDKNVILRKLPRVDDLLKEESLRELCMIYGKKGSSPGSAGGTGLSAAEDTV